MGLNAIILDFDGTLVESVGIKDRAFRELFAADHPDRIDDIMDYHLAHNATLRFEKFRHITETILGRPYTEADRERLSNRFSTLVFRAIVDCPKVAGLDDFLADFAGRVPLYLVSMSPDEELWAILRARDLTDTFTRVYAGSWPKETAIRDILSRHGAAPETVVYVGDAPEDRRSAETTGVPFIGRDSGKGLGEGIPVYPDLVGIHEHLNRLIGATGGAG